MPKRNANNTGSRTPLPDQMAAAGPGHPVLYTQQQQRNNVTTNYYAIPDTSDSNSSVGLHVQQQQQRQVCDDFPAPIPIPLVPHRASSGAWSPQDDNQLVLARMQGLNWSQIKDQYFPKKSPNACRKRHERLMERKGSDDWDNRKLQRLAKEYMGMRKEIWSGLAARTGEKWNVVEQKCMSNGIKNLQSAARAATRRERLENGPHFTGYDDDSGLSGIDLTPDGEIQPLSSYSSYPQSQQQFQQQQQQQQQQQHMQQHSPYAVAYAPPGYATQNDYSSSVSSTASMAAAVAAATASRRYTSHGSSERSSPYIDPERISGVDMGNGTAMNRSARRRGT
ncbi:myb family transcription factor [Drechmeria coniospora]|uniref:Myb family transcription factor n=1 Tax=Drechmeria coniospora TaxID=98403 RepID=A0A151GKK2_DRECN|nr:myb family transcription factor [Drechmeria coniospora]KYK57627.1 myb family transcription factor [Drechmeria coniospora]ODA79517.1 hypothetical protein RJ55_05110 [Drechmeria coniospora]